MHAGRVFAVSRPEDAHIPFVAEHLKDGQLTVVDPVRMTEGESLSYCFTDSKLQMLYKDEPVDDVLGVWYRKPTSPYEHEIRVDDTYVGYTRSAIERHIRPISYLLPAALWVSRPHSISYASHKPNQLPVAHEVGFNVPETIFTSSEKLASDFVARHGYCIAKQQSIEDPVGLIGLARLVSRVDNLDYSGLKVDPYIFQEYIEPAEELRIAVVRDKVFAASIGGEGIYAHEGSVFRDWRFAHFNNTFTSEAVKLPEWCNEACVELVSKLGLEFGAIDLIVDKGGRFWFLEINPNGQWAFIESHRQKIGSALARLLVSN